MNRFINKHRTMHAALVAIALLGIARMAEATSYNWIDLGTLGGNTSQATGINDIGQVVGQADTSYLASHAFLWQNGVMTDLGSLAGNVSWTQSRAEAINNAGQVVGRSTTASGYERAFLWENGIMSSLGTLGGSGSSAYDINNIGQVVGTSNTITGGEHAFLWQRGSSPSDAGFMIDLGTLGGSWSHAFGINDAGQVVGVSATASANVHAFFWQNGVMQDLGLLNPSYGGSTAFAINNLGQAVGLSPVYYGTSYAIVNGVMWQNGVIQNLGTYGGMTSAYDINDAGQVVGMDHTYGAADYRPLIWENGAPKELCSLSLNCATDAWGRGVANAINNKGEIVGYAYHGSINGYNTDRAFLALPTAVPVPPAAWLFGSGLLGMMAVARRRRA